MGIYLGTLFISFLFALLYKKGAENEADIKFKNGKLVIRKKIIYGIISFAPLTLIAGLRYDVGTDWGGTYINIFNTVKNGRSIRDVGYGLLNKFVLLFTSDYAGIIFLTALISGIFIYLAIFQQSDIPSMSILLYVFTCQYFFSLNVIRQAMATAIFLYAMKYIVKRDYKRYFFWIIIASTIHTMAIIYIPLYFYKILAKFYKQTIVIILLLLLFSQDIVNFVTNVFYNIEFLRKYFYWYFHSEYNSGNVSFVSLAVQISVLVFMLFIYYRNESDARSQLFITMQIICVAMLLFSGMIPLMQRISYFFSFANIIYIPDYISRINNRMMRFVASIIVITCFFAYMWVTTAIWNYNEVLPYQSIFN